ncbi:hypothetical protein BDW71DRAFT_61088 [Aspergillus fruticulosus]
MMTQFLVSYSSISFLSFLVQYPFGSYTYLFFYLSFHFCSFPKGPSNRLHTLNVQSFCILPSFGGFFFQNPCFSASCWFTIFGAHQHPGSLFYLIICVYWMNRIRLQ